MERNPISEREKPGEVTVLPPAEVLMSEEKAKEDLKHFVSTKNWSDYWIPRLAEEKEALPEPIKALIERVASAKRVRPSDNAQLTRYVVKRFNEINKRAVPEKIVVEDADKNTPEIISETDAINQTIESAEKTNDEMLEQKLLPVLSEQEKRDIVMKTSRKGAVKYWLNKLAPEINILRADIGEIVEKYIKEKKMPSGKQDSEFSKYINRRIAVIKFSAGKRAEMADLKNRLKQIDNGEEYEESAKKDRRNIFYEDGRMTVRQEDGGEKTVTTGDIAGDYLWGIKYSADKSLPRAEWRKISKFTALKDARSHIENIFNEELAETENVSLPTSSWTYEFIEKHYDEGVLAERMAQSILLRMQYDDKDSGIKVEPSNALEDAELKYDFKVILPRKKRGVAMEGEELPRPEYEEKKRKLGVQFTVSQIPKYLEHKRVQLKKARSEVGLEKYKNIIKKPVDDIVLVSVPLKKYGECFKKWLEAGKPSGGPEQYLTAEERDKLVSAVISGPAKQIA